MAQVLRLTRVKFAPLFLCVATLFLVGCATGVRDTSRTFDTVVIDAGHGGRDSGAVARNRILEKNATLDVARHLNSSLRAAGFKTVMTRKSDTFVALTKRAKISNRQDNAIFVSVHFNNSPKRSSRGVETYYKSPPSRVIAQRIQNRLLELPGMTNRGVKTANFKVLRLARYPAVLVECGFLSNGTEAKRIAVANYRKQIADKIADAIITQRNGHRHPPTPVQ